MQALEARRADPGRALRASLLGWLLRRRLWLAGTGLSLVGAALQAVALLLAPLTLVQPTLALGLVALLVLGRVVLDEPVGMRERLAGARRLPGAPAGARRAPAPPPPAPAPPAPAGARGALALALPAPWGAPGREPRAAVAGAAAG